MPPQGGIFLSNWLAQADKLAYDSGMRISLLLLLILSFTLQADIYRLVDSNGNVTFTDEPNSKAELIELEELPTYEPIAIPISVVDSTTTPLEESDVLFVPNYRIMITSPEQNQSIWTGGGILIASVSLQPKLSTGRADLLQFTLDGKNIGDAQTGASYNFENIERGSHILAVSVVDKKGRILATSKSILFQMHRSSTQGYGNAGG
ncbi:MAG: hypothetical protein ACI9QV_000447 [Methylophagaceae bacterium]